jgi:quinol monooxygenase YgiN
MGETVMIGICAQFTCQAGKNAEFEALLSEFVTTVKANEAGALVYQLCQNEKNNDEYFMIELYANAEALALHGKTDHMAGLISKIGAYLAGAPKILQGPAVH